MAMAKGAEVVKGSFSIPSDSAINVNYTLNFGKSFNKFMYIIEMTEESKTALMQTGENSNKAYARVGVYPAPALQSISPSNNYHISYRVNPATETPFVTTATINGITNSTILIPIGDVTGTSGNVLYRGFSYNYTIISLDNV